MRKLPKIVETDKEIIKFLDSLGWPEGLEVDKSYEIMCDDRSPDEYERLLNISFSCDGDAWAFTTGEVMRRSVRIRTTGGGGRNRFTRAALMILATAIRLDQGNN